MNESNSNLPQSNPFSTRFTAPGRTPFFFEHSFARRIKEFHPAKFEEFFLRALGTGGEIRSSVCLQFLADQFESNSRRGQIVGGHGSGKTSLMRALKDALVAKGYEIFSWTLHDQNRFLPDSFWIELQDFLQATPNFLPTRCLLPPPVVSRRDYLEQRKAEILKVLGTNEFQDSTEKAEEQEQFYVSDSVIDGVENENDTKGEPIVDESPSARREGSVFGFNEVGNFGLNLTRPSSRFEGDENEERVDESQQFEFAPFPGVAPENKPILSNDDEEYDDVRIEESSDVEEISYPDVPRPNVAAPLPAEAEFRQSRNFFERKIVFFDGFEQLSYVNRIIVRTFCRMNRLGLLLTSHEPVIGVPVLFRSTPSVETLEQLINFLLDDEQPFDDFQLENLLKKYRFNVREVLFALYDDVERSRGARFSSQDIVRNYPR